jgi:hypothetical protein
MTPQEFATEMEKLSILANGDPEAAHGKADDLLCEVLESLGYSDGVQIFVEMDKWYA